jgi:hypothetical protein
MIYEILQEFNYNNSSKYKLSIIDKYKCNPLWLRVVSMALDKVKYNYYIRKYPEVTNHTGQISLEQALDFLLELNNRTITGKMAIGQLVVTLSKLSMEDAYVIERILDRDLKINAGRSLFNKVSKDLITKPPYMRCGVYNTKTASKISYPAIVQEKCDGLYQMVTVDGDSVTFTSRSGEEREFPVLELAFKLLPSGIYMGELLIDGIDNRSESNGIINSDDYDSHPIYMVLWDYLQDFSDTSTYSDRFGTLERYLRGYQSNHLIRLVKHTVVNSISEALEFTSNIMTNGGEGSVLKDFSNVFKDHTSPTQLKLKLEIDTTVRITGFTEGTKGTKREGKVGAIMFETDDKNIKGQTSGFDDKTLDYITKNQSVLLGTLMDVTFNDLSKGRDNDYYALSHPRFKQFRPDITVTDTLDRVIELRQMAMELQ